MEAPTDISQLTIEYSGSEVVCSTTQLNSDSSVYLAGCTVAGRSTGDYTYGTEETVTYEAYSVGDEVSYNNVDYYVIEDSSINKETVILLKATLISYSDMQTYSSGTGASTGSNGDRGIIQYSASNNSYDSSYVKTVVDAWKSDQAPAALNARLITLDELINNFGYELDVGATRQQYIPSGSTPLV